MTSTKYPADFYSQSNDPASWLNPGKQLFLESKNNNLDKLNFYSYAKQKSLCHEKGYLRCFKL